jgi:hypothetical protein
MGFYFVSDLPADALMVQPGFSKYKLSKDFSGKK